MQKTEPASVSSALLAHLRQDIAAAGGWLPFDRYMAAVLYTPGLGYYANGSVKFGAMPSSGSDFVTAPEMTPLFGQALAVQLRQALDATGTDELWEFGAGSGALAESLLQALGEGVRRYTIVDLSGSLRARQQARLAAFGDRVQWATELPALMQGVVVGNEVLDAMPVQLLHFDGQRWWERGVTLDAADALSFADRETPLRPPVQAPFVPGTTVEIHPQAEAFVRTLAGQDAGLEVLGYTSQGRFLLNCGLAQSLGQAQAAGDVRTLAAGQKLVAEHEMGELFKVIGFAKGEAFDAIGFAAGDRSHRL